MVNLINKMITFPLYDSIISQIEVSENKELSKQEKDKFISDVKKLNQSGHEYIYALIKVYHMKNEENAYKLPYEMKSLKAGLRIDFSILPNELQHILIKFIQVHNNSKVNTD